jgi:hypothetical protein
MSLSALFPKLPDNHDLEAIGVVTYEGMSFNRYWKKISVVHSDGPNHAYLNPSTVQIFFQNCLL